MGINGTSFRHTNTKVLPVAVVSQLEISEQLNAVTTHVLVLKGPVQMFSLA